MSQRNSVIQELTHDLFSPKLVPALAQGAVIGVLLIIIEVSFAGMIYAGPLAPVATRAAGLTIFGAMVMCLWAGLFSPFAGIIAPPQDTPVAVLSATALALYAAMPDAPVDTLFATVTVTLMLSAVVTGASFCLIGKFKLANLIRFLPFPVVGGFLAGSGAALIRGSFGVMTDMPLTLENAQTFLTPGVMAFWVPGVVFAGALFFLMTTKPHYLLLPGALLAGLVLFFAALFLTGTSTQEARSAGWLLGALPQGRLWPAFTFSQLAKLDLPRVLSCLPDIFTVAFLSVVGMLLNLNGIELGTRSDIDMNRELLTEGTGNLLAGLGGAFAGYNTLSLSLLGPKTGTTSRLIPLVAAAICGVALFFGAQAMALFPKCLLGGLLFLLGLFFLDDWVFSGWKKLTPIDFSIVLLIVAAIVWFGFLEGVGLGLGMSILIFIVRFSRVSIISATHSGSDLHSTRKRSIPEQAILRREGHGVRIFDLSGYLFFGSAGSLGQAIAEALSGKSAPPRQLIINLGTITGFDVSAVNTLQRIAQQIQAKKAALVLAGAPSRMAGLLRNNTSPDVMANIHFAPSLDKALEHCEEALLTAEKARLSGSKEQAAASRQALFQDTADALESHLEALARFEALAETLAPFGKTLTLPQGEALFKEQEDPKGVFLLLWGSVSESREANGQATRVRTLEQGHVLGIPAALSPWQATTSARVDRDATLLFLNRAALATLETQAPELALSTTRLLLRQACREQLEETNKPGFAAI